MIRLNVMGTNERSPAIIGKHDHLGWELSWRRVSWLSKEYLLLSTAVMVILSNNVTAREKYRHLGIRNILRVSYQNGIQ